MTDIYSSMFRCLCLDLGYDLKGSYTLSELGDLRNSLLELAESEEWTGAKYAAFCQRFLTIFDDPSRGLEYLSEPSVFRDVYQILSFLLKKPAELTEIQTNGYIEKFKATERETRAWRVDPKRDDSRCARLLARYITYRGPGFDPQTILTYGRHGPGAVFGGEKGSDKNYFSSLPKTAKGLLGCLTLYANDTMAHLEPDGCETYLESRLTLVPKSYKGPRGVFVSPKEAVFCQLAIDAILKERVRLSGDFKNCWDPSSQTPSQEYALMGSYSGWYATLDLSDASDRVPLSLVNYLFRRPDYLALARSRPSHVYLPDGSRHKMAMLAPMGDGKTFSVLSIVCLSLTLAAIYVAEGGLASRFDYKKAGRLAKGVRVFGDDIIVPAKYATAVMSTLEAHNLRVNRSKSFWRGRFREACGCDAYKGIVVTPLRVTSKMTELSEETLTNWVAFANRVAVLYPRLERLRSLVVNHITARFYVGWTSRPDRNPSCLYRHPVGVKHIVADPIPDRDIGVARCCCYSEASTNGLKIRYNTDLQRLEQRCIVPCGVLEYPRANDPRWDISYWLLPKRASDLAQDIPWISDHLVIRGSYLEYKAILALQRRLPFARRWLLFPRRRLQYAWIPLE